jgi:hypothetical protein
LEVNEMKRLLISVCALALIAGAAFATVPEPSNCSCTLDGVGRMLLIPGGPTPPPSGPWSNNGNATFSVNVRNAANAPINNAVVEVLVGGLADGYTGLCAYQDDGLVKNTNVSGDVTFNVQGGGCFKYQSDAAQIRANGVIIRTYNHVMSPDYTGSTDVPATYLWSLTVNPQDLAAFVAAYQGGTGPASCHDYGNDGTTDPTDLAVFSSSYYGGVGACGP